MRCRVCMALKAVPRTFAATSSAIFASPSTWPRPASANRRRSLAARPTCTARSTTSVSSITRGSSRWPRPASPRRLARTPRLISAYREKKPSSLLFVSASTPSFKDGHAEGFHSMVRALVEELATKRGPHRKHVNILPPMVSSADLRHLREIAMAYGLGATLLPDYADTLDGVIVDHYDALPNGGTTIEEIAAMPTAEGTLDLTLPGNAARASATLEERGSPAKILGLPLGVRACDAFSGALADLSGATTPSWLENERGRLLDAYADGHKYVFGKRVAVFGEPEQVAAIALFLAEIGARPVVCATGARNRALKPALGNLPGGLAEA